MRASGWEAQATPGGRVRLRPCRGRFGRGKDGAGRWRGGREAARNSVRMPVTEELVCSFAAVRIVRRRPRRMCRIGWSRAGRQAVVDKR